MGESRPLTKMGRLVGKQHLARNTRSMVRHGKFEMSTVDRLVEVLHKPLDRRVWRTE